MRSVLGIDAAWTTTQPSGVALIASAGDGWRLLSVESTYDAFYRRAGLDDVDLGFDAERLLTGAARLSGYPVTMIAADIPLAHQPITARRASDNAVSRLYGARHASTHTPSATRPGSLADRMTADLAAAGYPLQTMLPVSAGLIEVYPHPALIELAAAPRRLPYKIGKTAKYWPGAPQADRRANLIAQWGHIVLLLNAQSPVSLRHCRRPRHLRPAASSKPMRMHSMPSSAPGSALAHWTARPSPSATTSPPSGFQLRSGRASLPAEQRNGRAGNFRAMHWVRFFSMARQTRANRTRPSGSHFTPRSPPRGSFPRMREALLAMQQGKRSLPPARE